MHPTAIIQISWLGSSAVRARLGAGKFGAPCVSWRVPGSLGPEKTSFWLKVSANQLVGDLDRIPPLCGLAGICGLPFNHRVTTPIIAVANQKGGVGKTTTSVNLAACVGRLGFRVLLVDMDPQANATSGVGHPKTEGASSYGPLLGEGPLEEKILTTEFENLSLVPSEVDLCGVEMELARAENHLHRLKGALEPIRQSGQYDLILIDCAPSLAILTLNAFASADKLLVPLQCEYYALEGISTIHRILGQLRESGVNPTLDLIGVVMTMFDGRTRLSGQVLEEVRQHFGETVFDTVIPRTTRLAEAPSHGQPIVYYDKYSAGAAAYEVLAEEFAQRLGLLQNTDSLSLEDLPGEEDPASAQAETPS